MTILRIRSCTRYAVRQPLRLVGPGESETRGLLIELGQEGCRISGLHDREFKAGEIVVLKLQKQSIRAVVRWASPGVIGVRFEAPLYIDQLGDLLAQTRHGLNEVRYGT